MKRSKKLTVEVEDEELEAIHMLMNEKGFNFYSDLLRECVNTYAGRVVLKKLRPFSLDEKYLDEGGWTFNGGVVLIDIYTNRMVVHFLENPEIETRRQLRMLHFLPKGDLWMRKFDRRAIPKVQALLKPI